MHVGARSTAEDLDGGELTGCAYVSRVLFMHSEQTENAPGHARYSGNDTPLFDSLERSTMRSPVNLSRHPSATEITWGATGDVRRMSAPLSKGYDISLGLTELRGAIPVTQ